MTTEEVTAQFPKLVEWFTERGGFAFGLASNCHLRAPAPAVCHKKMRRKHAKRVWVQAVNHDYIDSGGEVAGMQGIGPEDNKEPAQPPVDPNALQSPPLNITGPAGWVAGIDGIDNGPDQAGN